MRMRIPSFIPITPSSSSSPHVPPSRPLHLYASSFTDAGQCTPCIRDAAAAAGVLAFQSSCTPRNSALSDDYENISRPLTTSQLQEPGMAIPNRPIHTYIHINCLGLTFTSFYVFWSTAGFRHILRNVPFFLPFHLFIRL